MKKFDQTIVALQARSTDKNPQHNAAEALREHWNNREKYFLSPTDQKIKEKKLNRQDLFINFGIWGVTFALIAVVFGAGWSQWGALFFIALPALLGIWGSIYHITQTEMILPPNLLSKDNFFKQILLLKFKNEKLFSDIFGMSENDIYQILQKKTYPEKFLNDINNLLVDTLNSLGNGEGDKTIDLKPHNEVLLERVSAKSLKI